MLCCKLLAATAALTLAAGAASATSLTDDFSTDPFSTWTFGVGGTDPTTNRFAWNSTATPVYTGDATGALEVHLDSSLPTVRLQRPLGQTVTDTESFTLTTRFSFSVTSAPGDQGMQIAFGLVNSALTGGDRTGTPSNFSSDNTFHTVEFNYFPNISSFYGIGPTLTPAVFGAQKSGSDAFGNFAGFFGDASNLGGHTNGITALPQNVTLQAQLAYSGATKSLTLTMSQVNADGSVSNLVTGLPALDLVAAGYDTNHPFAVDTLAVMAYQDGFTATNDPSLVADVTFQRFDFTAVPEPATVTLAGLGLAALLLGRRKRRAR